MTHNRSSQPLTNILLKVFANGFYKIHGGLFMFFFLVMVGAVEPSQILNYHKLLMVAFISSPLMLMVVFAFWLIYSLKTWHYVAGQIFAQHQAFLFYSSTSFSKSKQLLAWLSVQVAVLMPVIAYGVIAVGVGIHFHYYIAPVAILLYLVLLAFAGAWIYTTLVNRLVDGGRQSVLLRWTSKWRKPYFSLYIFQVFDKMKVKYLLTKWLSYLIIIAVFSLFADVRTDARVAGIAMLAIITAHSVVIFELRTFEETYLSFTRNFPFSKLKLFITFIAVYACILVPEAIWLFSRFSPLLAVQLLLLGLSITLIFHGLLYWMGLNMDKYLPWILGLFMLIFWLILFRLLTTLIIVNLIAGFSLFYRNYYQAKKIL